MPCTKEITCQVCNTVQSKYTCSKCLVLYCSVPCYKRHQEVSCSLQQSAPNTAAAPVTILDQEEPVQPPQPPADADPDVDAEAFPEEPPPLRSLTSLKWPYIPDESAYPDPLKRDDPKMLQMHQYEAIATSPAIRAALASNPRLPLLLTSLDTLRGSSREDALHKALGVSDSGPSSQYDNALAGMTEEDMQQLRRLAEAVEGAVRGGKQDVLGLDWGEQA